MKSLAESLGLDADLKPLIEPALSQTTCERLNGRAFALAVLESPDFRRYIVGGLIAGDLPPAIAIRLMDYGWGKPIDRIEIKDRTDEDLTVEVVEQRLERVQYFLQLLRAQHTGEDTALPDDSRVH